MCEAHRKETAEIQPTLIFIEIFFIAAVLPFSALTSSSLTCPGPFKPSVSSKNNVIRSNHSESKPTESGEKVPQASGGLVTGAPSPPDVKENSVQPQITTAPSKVSKNLSLESKEDRTSGQKDANSISSPESNSSSHNEDELMIIDQSPPTNVDASKKIKVSKTQMHIALLALGMDRNWHILNFKSFQANRPCIYIFYAILEVTCLDHIYQN